MQIYSTRFRVKKTFTSEEFVSSVKEWSRSRRCPITDTEGTELSFIAGDDDNYLEVISLESRNVIAARTHEETKGGIWDTDFVLDYENNIVSVYVNRNISDTTLNMNSRSFMPGFISQIINNGFAEQSNGIEISDSAVRVTDAEILRNAVNSEDEYSLPLVYLSNSSKVDGNKLAAKLTGLATVVTDSDNILADDYPEPIYVFFPHRNMAPLAMGEYPFHRDIQMAVYNYHNSRDYGELETWNGVQNARINAENTDLLSKYRAITSDNDTLTEMYSELEEKIDKDSRLREELSFENNRLIAENAMLIQEIERLREGGTPILMRGQENEMYPDEQREIIISVLRKCLGHSVEENTRRHDVISSVIEANPVKGLPEQYQSIIRNAIDGYSTFETSKITSALKETGIEIIEHTGHYKIALRGDHRYVCTAAATCSDTGRGGKNLISEINKIMF